LRANFYICLILLISTQVFSQDIQEDKFNIGLQISLDQTQMQYRLADWVHQNISELKNIDAKAGLGFSAGISAEYRIGDKTGIRIVPLFSFHNNNLIFTTENNQKMVFEIQPISLGIPIHLVFSPRGTQRMPYFFIGPRIQQHLGRLSDPSVFFVNKTDLSGEFGVGIKLNFYKISILPQLSFSQGFSDLKAIGESGLYNNAIRSMNRNRLSFSIVFF